MTRRLATILLFLMPVATTVVAQDDSQDLYGRHIRHISLQQSNVFPDEEESTFESMANSLHIVTREGVIRGRLLFEEGDVLDEELLHQSKRRLRSLDIFSRRASIRSTTTTTIKASRGRKPRSPTI